MIDLKIVTRDVLESLFERVFSNFQIPILLFAFEIFALI